MASVRIVEYGELDVTILAKYVVSSDTVVLSLSLRSKTTEEIEQKRMNLEGQKPVDDQAAREQID